MEFADSALAAASADFDSAEWKQIGSRTIVWKRWKAITFDRSL